MALFRGGPQTTSPGLTWLECHAVIPVVDYGVPDHHIVAAINVPSISVSRPMRRCRSCIDRDIIVNDIFAFIHLKFARWYTETAQLEKDPTRLFHSGLLTIVISFIVTSVAWNNVIRIGRSKLEFVALQSKHQYYSKHAQ